MTHPSSWSCKGSAGCTSSARMLVDGTLTPSKRRSRGSLSSIHVFLESSVRGGRTYMGRNASSHGTCSLPRRCCCSQEVSWRVARGKCLSMFGSSRQTRCSTGTRPTFLKRSCPNHPIFSRPIICLRTPHSGGHACVGCKASMHSLRLQWTLLDASRVTSPRHCRHGRATRTTSYQIRSQRGAAMPRERDRFADGSFAPYVSSAFRAGSLNTQSTSSVLVWR
mmetsp:Transcript_42905/g.112754  ORF Transcript_42905/g.112754 Transcript_42905/m.112754 type:complete len:222 (+) Transcript_42905:135-800(+)